MNAGQLKKLIENVPDNMDVMIEQMNTEYQFSLAGTAEIRTVKFSDGKLKAKDDCFVITDEI